MHNVDPEGMDVENVGAICFLGSKTIRKQRCNHHEHKEGV